MPSEKIPETKTSESLKKTYVLDTSVLLSSPYSNEKQH